jgi:peptidyl-prolyl cis-trans isomerase B (cyclophilin B)
MAVNLAVLTMLILQPVRLYFQPGFPVPVRIDAAALAKAGQPDPKQPLTLVMLSPRGDVEAKANIEAGKDSLDLAALFPGPTPVAPAAGAGGDGAAAPEPGKDEPHKPHLWDGKTHYLQLALGDTPVGSALVVVPLSPPNMRRLAAEPPNALRIEPERLVSMKTTAGTILIRLDPDAAPNTVAHFESLVDGGFYTNVIFHRIVPEFVIQGGDPTGTGRGGPGYLLDLEPSAKLHQRGTLSMARQGQDVNTGGSQFFICLSREKCAQLDGQYTAFGDVVEGLDVVDKIAASPLADPRMGRPSEPTVILRSELVPAPPRPISRSADAGRRAGRSNTTQTAEPVPARVGGGD